MKNIEELLEYLKLIENEILNAANDTLQMSVFTFFQTYDENNESFNYPSFRINLKTKDIKEYALTLLSRSNAILKKSSEIKDFNYNNNKSTIDFINLNINKGEFVCIIGKNGSGKSTFSKLLSGLLPFKDGKIIVNGINLKDKKKTLEIRKTIGIVFQNPENQILFDKVYDDIAFSLQNLGFSKEQIPSIIDEALNSVNMSEYKNSYTDTLSLGQKQRIAIASTLAINPNLLILDEPTTMLDPINKTAIYKTLNNLHEKSITIIYITNNIDEILLADRILFLENGEIKEDFKKETLLNHLDSLKDFEAPGIISLIKKLSNKQISALNINDLLNIYK